VALSGWGFAQVASYRPADDPTIDPTAREVLYSQLLVLVTFMFSFILALSAAFVAAPMVANDVESGVALAVLARPLRRETYLLGRWLGILLLIAVYAVGSGIAELIVVRAVTGYLPPHPTEAVLFLVGEATVLLTLTATLATRLPAMTAGIVALALFGLAWIGGIVGGIGLAIGNEAVAQAGTISRYLLPTDGLWRGTVFQLEPLSMLLGGLGGGPAARAYPFYEPAPPPPSYVWWAIGWIVVVLLLGLLSFRRREL
jgi:ABC-type transport system involved in multi-copper enzyme maturation permease subunit